MLYLGGSNKATPTNVLSEIEQRVNSEFDANIVKCLKLYVGDHLSNSESEFELVLSIVHLNSGMIVSRPIFDKRGEVLVAKDSTITEDILEALWNRQMKERSVGDIYIYKSSAANLSSAA
jgi:hypothetical protein